MKTEVKSISIPRESIVHIYPLNVNYEDVFSANFDNRRNVSVDYFAKNIFASMPEWSLYLFKLRNFLVKFVGLQGGNILDSIEEAKKSDCGKGSLIGIFKVYERNDSEIMFVEKDSHLDFSGSLLLKNKDNSENKKSAEDSELIFITRVQYNRKLGNFYFFFVKPFHRLIIKSLLKRMVRNFYAGK